MKRKDALYIHTSNMIASEIVKGSAGSLSGECCRLVVIPPPPPFLNGYG